MFFDGEQIGIKGKNMVHVIASITVQPNTLSDALAIYQSFAPQVHQEKGCLMYQPTIDIATQIGTQEKNANTITVIEKWQDMASFNAHLVAPHVLQFRENMKGIIDTISIKVLESAL